MPIVEGLETPELRDVLVSLLLTKANNNQVLMPHLDEDEHKMLRKNPGNVWWSAEQEQAQTRELFPDNCFPSPQPPPPPPPLDNCWPEVEERFIYWVSRAV